MDSMNMRSTSEVKWNLKALENLQVKTIEIAKDPKMSFVITADAINWDWKTLLLEAIVRFSK
ncbi:hypothetical protein WN944_023277 [Citrus x changshan-huyou]|uniref:Uncharacterized protein n=1 Tax=Citrus x changshan-huyou TaxID=2935761 RepID=A0AAP0R149_9ROSI